jgi:hypothetical protein
MTATHRKEYADESERRRWSYAFHLLRLSVEHAAPTELCFGLKQLFYKHAASLALAKVPRCANPSPFSMI